MENGEWKFTIKYSSLKSFDADNFGKLKVTKGRFHNQGKLMPEFIIDSTDVVMTYGQDNGTPNEWVWKALNTDQTVLISRMFTFETQDLRNPPSEDQDFDEYEYYFSFGTIVDDYIVIPGRILSIDRDVHIHRSVKLNRKVFAAERNVSVFGRLTKLLEHSGPVIVGGKHSEAIPASAFEELQRKFPTTWELDRYASARVHHILANYIDGMKDARARYEQYLNKKSLINHQSRLELDVLNKREIEKYTLIRDVIKDALKSKTNLSEDDWQRLMIPFLTLLFPKYIKVLEKVRIADYYSNPLAKTDRIIDIALVDANGNLDIIEVKKPFDDKILRKTPYRDNYIPTSELSGGIMQAEKYLFHLSKWGIEGEKRLTKKFSDHLPDGMSIHISSPKAIIIVGRDQIAEGAMTNGQLLDFEIIKRKYANMIDIITYDDLLRRLDNTIMALEK